MPSVIDSYNNSISKDLSLEQLQDANSVEKASQQKRVEFQLEIAMKDSRFASLLSDKPTLSEPKTSGKSVGTINMLSEDALMTMLGFENTKSQIKSAQSSLKTNASIKKQENDQLIDKLQEHAKKVEEDAKLSGIKKIFKIIGAVLGVVAGIAACVATGGGGLAIAGLVIGSLLSAETIMSTATDGEISLTAACTKLFGEEAGPWVSMGIQLALTISSIGMSAASVYKAGKAATDVASGVEKVASAASNIQKYNAIAGAVSKGTSVLNAATNIATSAFDIVSSVNQNKIANLKADQKILQALMNSLMAEDERTAKRLEEVLENSRGNAEKVKEIVDELNEVTAATVSA